MRQCNFCGKREDDTTVDFFVSNGSTICSECVKNCWELKNKKTRIKKVTAPIRKMTPRACLKNKSYTKHKSYYCLLILKISKINIIYIIIDIF